MPRQQRTTEKTPMILHLTMVALIRLAFGTPSLLSQRRSRQSSLGGSWWPSLFGQVPPTPQWWLGLWVGGRFRFPPLLQPPTQLTHYSHPPIHPPTHPLPTHLASHPTHPSHIFLEHERYRGTKYCHWIFHQMAHKTLLCY